MRSVPDLKMQRRKLIVMIILESHALLKTWCIHPITEITCTVVLVGLWSVSEDNGGCNVGDAVDQRLLR